MIRPLGSSQIDAAPMQMPRSVGCLQRPHLLDDTSGIPRSRRLPEGEIRRLAGGQLRPVGHDAHHGRPSQRQPQESQDQSAASSRSRLPGTLVRLLLL